MNRILLAMTILGASAGGFLTARQSTIQLESEATATREAWLVQTQLVATAQSEQAGLTERFRQLKLALAQLPAVAGSALWSALQTNRADHLPPELRERLLEELGFNWQASQDFIVVSKQTVRDIGMIAIRDGKLTDLAATVLALTPEERGQVEAAVQRVPSDFKDWVLTHVERSEPKDDVMAQYSLPSDPVMSQTISNNFATGLSAALGRERAELILTSARNWMVNDIGLYDCVSKPHALIVKRYLAGTEQRLKFQIENDNGRGVTSSHDLTSEPQWNFPRAFRPLFPNGWADVAQREGFELPKESQKK